MPRSPRSIANSAGVFRHAEVGGDFVRPGIMLYGATPFAFDTAEMLGLAPVMTLRSELARIEVERHTRSPESVYHYLCALELYDRRKPFYNAEGHQASLFGLAATFDEARMPDHARIYYRMVIRFGHAEYGYVQEARTWLERLEKVPDPLP